MLIGGPPRAGKTTVARRLARRHGFRLYSAEGSVVPADAVAAGIVDASRAVWLLPTPEFQQAQLAAHEIVCECGDRRCDQDVETTVGRAAHGPVLAARE